MTIVSWLLLFMHYLVFTSTLSPEGTSTISKEGTTTLAEDASPFYKDDTAVTAMRGYNREVSQGGLVCSFRSLLLTVPITFHVDFVSLISFDLGSRRRRGDNPNGFQKPKTSGKKFEIFLIEKVWTNPKRGEGFFLPDDPRRTQLSLESWGRG